MRRLFWQEIVSGLIVGSLYGLAALGMVLIYKTSDVVNFAQGEMAMFSTFVAAAALRHLHWGFIPAFLLAMAFSAVLGLVIERTFMRPVQNAPVLTLIIITLGLFFVIRGIAGAIWGYYPNPFPADIGGEPLAVKGVYVVPHDLFAFAVALVLMTALYLLLRFTLAGIAMRAISQNLAVARLMGIPVNRILSLTWALAAVLGGVAGILVVPITYLSPTMMGDVIIKAFAGAVLGGFSSLPGAVLGGMLLGVLENLVAGYVSTQLKSTFVFALILVVLYVRPTGLLGARAVKRV